MIKKPINQNHSFDLELLKSIDYNYIFNNEPINRSKNKINNTKKSEEDKITKLINLKQEINSIEDCKLKNNATKLVFGDGNIQSSIMIVGRTRTKRRSARKTLCGRCR